MPAEAPTKTCPCCDGTGHVLDSVKVGIEQRDRRKAAGVTLEELSEQIALSIGYLSNLENGRHGKPWNHDLLKRYNDAVEAAAKKKKLTSK